MMDIHAILKQLPHRYPFLLVDKVIELESNTRIKAIKNVTFNEPYFMGHFPGHPVMPGVLILEALAQAAGLLAFDAMGKVPDENNIYYFVGIDGARFKRPVEPGDQLILEITIDRGRGGVRKFKGVARVCAEVACEAKLMCTRRSVIQPACAIGTRPSPRASVHVRPAKSLPLPGRSQRRLARSSGAPTNNTRPRNVCRCCVVVGASRGTLSTF